MPMNLFSGDAVLGPDQAKMISALIEPRSGTRLPKNPRSRSKTRPNLKAVPIGAASFINPIPARSRKFCRLKRKPFSFNGKKERNPGLRLDRLILEVTSKKSRLRDSRVGSLGMGN